jgi:hypothetical protein
MLKPKATGFVSAASNNQTAQDSDTGYGMDSPEPADYNCPVKRLPGKGSLKISIPFAVNRTFLPVFRAAVYIFTGFDKVPEMLYPDMRLIFFVRKFYEFF